MNTKQTTLFCVLALLGGVIGGFLSDGLPGKAVAKSDVEKVVRAEKFQLVDGKGIVRASFYTLGDSDINTTHLEIGSSADDHFAKLVQYPWGIYLELDTKGGTSVKLGSEIHQSYIEFEDIRNDRSKLFLGVDGTGNPNLRFIDEKGRPRLLLGKTELKNTKTGSTEIRSIGSIVIFDEKGKVVYSVP